MEVLTGHYDTSALGLRADGGRFQCTADSKEQSMKCIFSWRPFALVLAAVSVLALASPAHAEQRAYASRGKAQFVSANDFVGSAVVLHRLGHHATVPA